MTIVHNRKPNLIDVSVGEQLRFLRVSRRMSQQDLGEKVGVTFQQIQKYERAANRIGASRLWQFSDIFAVPVGEFYKNVERSKKRGQPKESGNVESLSKSTYGIKLAEAIVDIQSKDLRHRLLTLARSMADLKE